MTTCSECHKECSIVHKKELEESEFWGANTWLTVTVAVSTCCHAEIEEVEPCQ